MIQRQISFWVCTFGASGGGKGAKPLQGATKTAKKGDKAARIVLYCYLYSQQYK